jgi:DNA (cytosine-5)-methyltransferase 1
MTHISLFSGIGGIDLAAEWAGFETIAQVEIDPYCKQVLEKHWPGVHRVSDIRDFPDKDYGAVTLVSGGDPCPCRSRARSSHGSKHPDMSGYFLAVVGRLQPQWVVRENVPAPDVVNFEAALDCLGYRVFIATTNAAPYTGQNRCREIIVVCLERSWLRRTMDLFIQYSDEGTSSALLPKAEGYPCLTTHPWRYDARDGYIWEASGFRVADSDERLCLSGFPAGWVGEISHRKVARMCGNAVVPQQVYPVLKAIAEVTNEN